MIAALVMMTAVPSERPSGFDAMGYPTAQLEQEVSTILDTGIALWMRCAKAAARQMSRSREAAPVVAVAALTKCTEWEKPLPEMQANLVAIKVSRKTGFDFKGQYRFAQEERATRWQAMRQAAENALIADVVTRRTPKD